MIPGRPELLRRCAETQGRHAALAEAAADRLVRIEPDGVSRAVDTLRGGRGQVGSDLERLRADHMICSDALAEYALALERAQRRAGEADASRARIDAEALEAEHRLARLRRHRTVLDDPLTLAEVEQRIVETRAHLDRLEWARADADAAHRAAELDRDAAAEAALARLGPAMLEGAPPGGGRASTERGADVPRGPDDAAAAPEGVLARARDHALGLLGEALLSAATIALGGRLLAGLAHPYRLVGLAGLLTAFIRTSIATDVHAATPAVRPLRVPAPAAPRRPAAALREAAEVDELGAGERTVVKITAVPGVDGVARWRVALPSTQEWVTRFGDHGAVNDLDANLALVLTPRQRTQYERGVLEAMRQAGIGAEDPVLLVGFSQGGIMAGHLASGRDGHHWAGVIAAGAPIDSMPIPSTVDVVSVEHLGDPVPRLERDLGLGGRPDHHRAWTTVRQPSASTAQGLSGIHSAVEYDATLRRHASAVMPQHPGLAAFYAADGREYARYYAWEE